MPEAARRGVSDEPLVPDRRVESERTGETRIVPAGIDPGWHRNPGKLRLQHVEAILKGRLEDLPDAARIVALRDIATSWRVRRILDEGAPGSVPIAALDASLSTRLGSKTSLVSISDATVEKQQDRHPELKAEDYERLVDLLQAGKVVTQGDTHLAFVEKVVDLPWIAVLKRTRDGREMFLVSMYRSASARYVARLLERGEIWRE